MGKEGITFGQGLEVASWLARLSRDEYQKRRAVLRKVTDPRAKLTGELAHPFLTPLYEGWRLEEEGPSCDDPIVIGDLDFVAGDVVDRDRAVSGSAAYTRFSQHHAEHLIGRANELPFFPENTEIVFPGTVYAKIDSRRIESFACIRGSSIGFHISLIELTQAFRPSCRFPYLLHTRR